MKIKEYELYRGLYCSLCKAMGKYFGVLSRATLSYDITFLLLMRLSFLGVVPNFKKGRCSFNPAKKCNYCTCCDEEFKYAASISIVMFYFKVKDNISDGSCFKRLLMYLILPWAKAKYKKAKDFYPEISCEIAECMIRQNNTEKEKSDLTDKAAHESAKALGEIFAYGMKEQTDEIRRFGYGIGKWVYLMDAADDVEDDIKSGSYNVFILKYALKSKDDLTENIKKKILGTLNMSSALACEAYDKIHKKTMTPIAENIIFSGINLATDNIFERKKIK